MNVLFVISSSEIGGAQRWVKDQISMLKDADVNIFLVTNQEGWLTTGGSEKCTIIFESRISHFLSIFGLLNLIKIIKAQDIDLVIASSASAGVFSRLGSLITSRRVIYVSHGWSALYRKGILAPCYRLVETLLSRITDSILCVSQADYDDGIKKLNIPIDRLELLSNKILLPSKHTYFTQSSLNKKIELLTVCRLAYPKRVDLLINAVRGLDLNLTIVGDGPQRDQLQKSSVGIENINFLGAVDGFSAFNEYDIFVLLSDSEGLPMSAIEAMGFGLPLLLSDVGGCQELVRFSNGFVVGDEINEIRTKLSEIIVNLPEMSRRSVELFQASYDLESCSKVYIDYYQRVISG